MDAGSEKLVQGKLECMTIFPHKGSGVREWNGEGRRCPSDQAGIMLH
jgi:hypothetical protein